ncbi:MAG: 1-acyl-sn-glycerol-3-phosphate acyltransferase, partial [Shewanella xiamenensis]|nr:1-acyl-sn-glycerol-3-phosphate acyltransferase [Shewanella xiamenensis]
MFTHLCRWLLKISGWQIQGELPNQAKYIVIVAPHTSNWDFIIGVLARGALATRIHFLGKHQLFIPPWGWFFRAIG